MVVIELTPILIGTHFIRDMIITVWTVTFICEVINNPNKPMTYTPTPKELEEMGFTSYKLYFILDVCDLRIVCWFDDYLSKIH